MIVSLQTLFFYRESIINTLHQLIQPYILNFLPSARDSGSDDGESEEVFAEYDEEKGVVFFPPLYLQRYAAVFDCLMDDRWRGKLEKVLDLGYNNMAFIKYLKDLAGVKYILGVDLEGIALQSMSEFFKNDSPKPDRLLQIVLYRGNAADPDYRLIGCDAVVSIEMIEHMLPHDLDRLLHTVFGFIKPRIAVFTTPNGDFNVLFKSLESNGLRRLDHFFEWSREQFHDWCSNIVVRYPGYTVSCKGVGPGPAGTEHLGCCSQLALFVAKDYHKQEDLNLNSLTLVATTSDPNNQLMPYGWDVIRNVSESKMICAPFEESSSDSSTLQKSRMSLVLSPTCPLDSMHHEDKNAQCNLETEVGKGFLMFNDEEIGCSTVVPRKRNQYKVYLMEDTTRRLNCTSLQVTKFSTATKNIMSKNNTDSLVYSSEMIEEIRQLTKMLNLNKNNNMKQIQDGGHVWCNINWGENAPYWNQYYKLVQEYNYPFETISEDSRIIDAISEEINRLLDTPDGAMFTVDGTRLEIPIEHLMTVVNHITTDVDKVKDLLEWNGYEIYNDVLVHSLLMIENVTEPLEEDWHDNETYTESDATETRSTAQTDRNYLRRALDMKVQKLRSIAEADITIELDRVFSQLLNMALRKRKHHTPIPTTWLQSKLLDLLTLTEKAIERRNLLILDKCRIRDQYGILCHDIKAINDFKEDCSCGRIVDKYRHIVEPLSENTQGNFLFDDYVGLAIVESIGEISSSPPFKELENTIQVLDPRHFVDPRTVPHISVDKIERIEAWMDEDAKLAQYEKMEVSESGDTDPSESIDLNSKQAISDFKTEGVQNSMSNTNSTIIQSRKSKRDVDSKNKRKFHEKIGRKIVHKKSHSSCTKKSNSLVRKNSSVLIESSNHIVRPHSKPIPGNIMHIRYSDIKDTCKLVKPVIVEIHDKEVEESYKNISATENVDVLNIVTDEKEEVIVLRRSIGTDAQPIPEYDGLEENVIGIVENEIEVQNYVSNVQLSQAVFPTDINEPTTSKGIRHSNFDVQCGSNVNLPLLSMMTTSTSFTRIPSIFTAGLDNEIIVTELNVNKNVCDFGTSTYFDEKNITPFKSVYGITIKDSLPNVCTELEGSQNTEAQAFNMINESSKSYHNNTEVSARMPNSNIPVLKSNFQSKMKENLHKNFTANTQTEITDDKEIVTKSLMCDSPNTTLEQMVDAELHGQTEEPNSYGYLTPTETILKPKTSDTKLDSGSGFDLSLSSSPISNSNYFTMKPNNNKNAAEKLTKYVSPKLSCCGTHVHSFKERQESEDVMYLGRWDKINPRVKVKKTIYMVAQKKSILRRKWACPKEELTAKKVDFVSKMANIQMRNAKMIESRRNAVNTLIQKQKDNASKSNYKKYPKAPSRNAKGNVSSKKEHDNTRSTVTTVSTLEPIKKYLPLYLRKKKSTHQNDIVNKTEKAKYNEVDLRRKSLVSPKDNILKNKTVLHHRKHILNKSFDSAKSAVDIIKEDRINNIQPFVRSKTEETKSNVLKYRKFAVTSLKNIQKVDSKAPTFDKKSISKDMLNKSIDSAITKVNRQKQLSTVRPLLNLNTEEKNTSLNFKGNCKNVKVAVYRNDIITKNDPSKCTQTLNSTRSSVPSSLASEQPITTRSKDMSICKVQSSSLLNENIKADNDTNAPLHQKISSAKADANNKENKPVTPKTNVTAKKPEIKKINTGQHANVFRSQLNASGSILKLAGGSFKNKPEMLRKSNFRNLVAGCFDIKKISLIESVKKNVSISPVKSSQYCTISKPTEHVSITEMLSKEDNSLLQNQNIQNQVTDRNSNLELSFDVQPDDTKTILEDSLEFVDCNLADTMSFDSATVVLRYDEEDIYDDASPTSYKTVITNDDFFSEDMEKELELSLNSSYDFSSVSNYFLGSPNIPSTINEMSVQSILSVSSPRTSEYFLADNEITKTAEFKPMSPVNVSVRDIFERKDNYTVQNPVSVLASQAFSGFSVNAAPDKGGQPDRVNLIDSETGSIALIVDRHVASEEVVVAGRSTDSTATFQLDEDAVVPSWLFNIISQHQSELDDLTTNNIPEPLPPTEPLVDLNGNAVDGMAAGSGAGDGQGVHSDQSQDSSGRGSSISSSVTSGSHSGALLVDPFTGQYEMVQADNSQTFASLGERTAAQDSSFSDTTSANNSQIVNRPLQHTMELRVMISSDGDADVSSLDTDNHDSDN